MTGVDEAQDPFDLGERVAEVLVAHDVPALLIGAVALARHGYARATEDIDFGVAIAPRELEVIADALRQRHYVVILRKSDAQDPLGGVIDVRAEEGGALVQVVNFDNSPGGGFPRVIRDALRLLGQHGDERIMQVIPVAQLVALKVYAGGTKSERDIRELLRVNPGVDRAAIRELLVEYRLGVEMYDRVILAIS